MTPRNFDCLAKSEDGDTGTELTQMLIDEEARLYVCGDAKGMARGVQVKLEEILVAERGLEPAESVELVKKLRQEKRYLEDVWT